MNEQEYKEIAFNLLNSGLATHADVGEFVYGERNDETRMRIARRVKDKDIITFHEAKKIVTFYQRIADKIYEQLDSLI